MGRDDDSIEAAEEWIVLPGDGKFLAREIGDRVGGNPQAAKLFEDGHRLFDGAIHGLEPALVEGPDEIGLLGEERDAFGDGLGEGLAPVHLQVPFARTDAGEEILAFAIVGNQLAIERARIPADQHIADVEDRYGLTLFHVSVATSFEASSSW